MELVYLWVEDYKNIHHQGFNFSPKFTYSYDSKNLTFVKHDNYIKNFFGKDINVTAIVGKNGSGKSSVLKVLLSLIYSKKNKDYKLSDKEIFLIIYDKKIKKISLNNSLKNIPELSEKELNFFTLYLNYMLDTLLDDWYQDSWITKIYHKKDNYDIPLLIQPTKYDESSMREMIDLSKISFLNTQKTLLFYKNIETNKTINNFFNPNLVQKKLLFSKYLFNSATNDSIDLKNMRKITNSLGSITREYSSEIALNQLSNKIMHPLLKKVDDDFEYMNLLYLAFKILLIDDKIFKDKDNYEEFKKVIIEAINKSVLPSKKYLLEYNYEKLLKEINQDDYRIKKILISLKFNEEKIYNDPIFKKLMNSDEKIKIEEIKDILDKLPSWIDIDFWENDKSFSSLSSGEKSLFMLLMDILSQIKKVKIHYKTINIILDETELGLHPQWQKEYLKNILKAVKNYANSEFQINLIFATHSPFLLSDIPKQNIIFLDKDEKGNCKVVDGLKEKKQTFGANIHTLLSDSFFMEDGLMGEFAKDKIDDVISYLNDDKNTKIKDNDESQQLINIIGEPIVRNQLQRKLDSKRLEKIDEIDVINKKIKQMAYELKVLKEHQSKIVQDELKDNGKQQYKEGLRDDKNH